MFGYIVDDCPDDMPMCCHESAQAVALQFENGNMEVLDGYDCPKGIYKPKDYAEACIIKAQMIE